MWRCGSGEGPRIEIVEGRRDLRPPVRRRIWRVRRQVRDNRDKPGPYIIQARIKVRIILGVGIRAAADFKVDWF
jgi:hypothetical protein